MENIKFYWKKFCDFLHKDSWPSLIVSLLIAVIFIKFVFFPVLSLVTGTSLPIVIVESCSMYHHEEGFEKTLESPIYSSEGISLEDTENWDFQNGLNKGDIIFVVGAKNLKVGDVIIFHGGTNHPLIHRLVSTEEIYATKGDNYKTNVGQLNSEKNISEDQFVGKALFKIPYVGWAKLIFFEGSRPSSKKGLCK